MFEEGSRIWKWLLLHWVVFRVTFLLPRHHFGVHFRRNERCYYYLKNEREPHIKCLSPFCINLFTYLILSSSIVKSILKVLEYQIIVHIQMSHSIDMLSIQIDTKSQFNNIKLPFFASHMKTVFPLCKLDGCCTVVRYSRAESNI